MALAFQRKNPVREFSEEEKSFVDKGNVSGSQPSSGKSKRPVKKKPVESPVMLSARVPQRIMDGLFEVVVERKRKKADRSTQQDVVAEILEEWLQAKNYLK